MEVEKRLEYISRQLGRLDIIQTLPKSEVSPDEVIDCAMDVRSAIMIYLAVNISRLSRKGNTTGLIIDTYLGIDFRDLVTKSGQEFSEAENDLQSAIQEFNSALSHFSHSISFTDRFRTFEEVKGEL